MWSKGDGEAVSPRSAVDDGNQRTAATSATKTTSNRGPGAPGRAPTQDGGGRGYGASGRFNPFYSRRGRGYRSRAPPTSTSSYPSPLFDKGNTGIAPPTTEEKSQVSSLNNDERRELNELRSRLALSEPASARRAEEPQVVASHSTITPEKRGGPDVAPQSIIRVGTPSQEAVDIIEKSAQMSMLKQQEYYSPAGIEVLIALVVARIELKLDRHLSDKEVIDVTYAAFGINTQKLYKIATSPPLAASFFTRVQAQERMEFAEQKLCPSLHPKLTPNMANGIPSNFASHTAGELRLILRTWSNRFYPGRERDVKERLAKLDAPRLRKYATTPGAYASWLRSKGEVFNLHVPSAFRIDPAKALQTFKPGTMDQAAVVRVHNIPAEADILPTVPEYIFHGGVKTPNSDTFETILLGGDFLLGTTLSPSPVDSVEIERKGATKVLVLRGRNRQAMALFSERVIGYLGDYVPAINKSTLRLDTSGLQARGNDAPANPPHLVSMGTNRSRFRRMTLSERKQFVRANIGRALTGRVASAYITHAIRHIEHMSEQGVSDMILDQTKYNAFIVGLGGTQKKWKWGEGSNGSNVEHEIVLRLSHKEMKYNGAWEGGTSTTPVMEIAANLVRSYTRELSFLLEEHNHTCSLRPFSEYSPAPPLNLKSSASTQGDITAYFGNVGLNAEKTKVATLDLRIQTSYPALGQTRESRLDGATASKFFARVIDNLIVQTRISMIQVGHTPCLMLVNSVPKEDDWRIKDELLHRFQDQGLPLPQHDFSVAWTKVRHGQHRAAAKCIMAYPVDHGSIIAEFMKLTDGSSNSIPSPTRFPTTYDMEPVAVVDFEGIAPPDWEMRGVRMEDQNSNSYATTYIHGLNGVDLFTLVPATPVIQVDGEQGHSGKLTSAALLLQGYVPTPSGIIRSPVVKVIRQERSYTLMSWSDRAQDLVAFTEACLKILPTWLPSRSNFMCDVKIAKAMAASSGQSSTPADQQPIVSRWEPLPGTGHDSWAAGLHVQGSTQGLGGNGSASPTSDAVEVGADNAKGHLNTPRDDESFSHDGEPFGTSDDGTAPEPNPSEPVAADGEGGEEQHQVGTEIGAPPPESRRETDIALPGMGDGGVSLPPSAGAARNTAYQAMVESYGVCTGETAVATAPSPPPLPPNLPSVPPRVQEPAVNGRQEMGGDSNDRRAGQVPYGSMAYYQSTEKRGAQMSVHNAPQMAGATAPAYPHALPEGPLQMILEKLGQVTERLDALETKRSSAAETVVSTVESSITSASDGWKRQFTEMSRKHDEDLKSVQEETARLGKNYARHIDKMASLTDKVSHACSREKEVLDDANVIQRMLSTSVMALRAEISRFVIRLGKSQSSPHQQSASKELAVVIAEHERRLAAVMDDINEMDELEADTPPDEYLTQVEGALAEKPTLLALSYLLRLEYAARKGPPFPLPEPPLRGDSDSYMSAQSNSVFQAEVDAGALLAAAKLQIRSDRESALKEAQGVRVPPISDILKWELTHTITTLPSVYHILPASELPKYIVPIPLPRNPFHMKVDPSKYVDFDSDAPLSVGMILMFSVYGEGDQTRMLFGGISQAEDIFRAHIWAPRLRTEAKALIEEVIAEYAPIGVPDAEVASTGSSAPIPGTGTTPPANLHTQPEEDTQEAPLSACSGTGVICPTCGTRSTDLVECDNCSHLHHSDCLLMRDNGEEWCEVCLIEAGTPAEVNRLLDERGGRSSGSSDSSQLEVSCCATPLEGQDNAPHEQIIFEPAAEETKEGDDDPHPPTEPPPEVAIPDAAPDTDNDSASGSEDSVDFLGFEAPADYAAVIASLPQLVRQNLSGPLEADELDVWEVQVRHTSVDPYRGEEYTDGVDIGTLSMSNALLTGRVQLEGEHVHPFTGISSHGDGFTLHGPSEKPMMAAMAGLEILIMHMFPAQPDRFNIERPTRRLVQTPVRRPGDAAALGHGQPRAGDTPSRGTVPPGHVTHREETESGCSRSPQGSNTPHILSPSTTLTPPPRIGDASQSPPPPRGAYTRSRKARAEAAAASTPG